MDNFHLGELIFKRMFETLMRVKLEDAGSKKTVGEKVVWKWVSFFYIKTLTLAYFSNLDAFNITLV